MVRQIQVVKASKLLYFLWSVIFLASCVASKGIKQDAKYHSDALGVCLKYMVETEGVLIGKYPFNTGRLYINSNLFVYRSARNGLYKEFIENEKNKAQIKGLCITINDLEVNSRIPCQFDLVPVKIIDQDGHSYSSYARSSPNGKYRDIVLHLFSPILFDYSTGEYCVFLTIFYGFDRQNIRFDIERIKGTWRVIDYADWWEY